MKKFVFTISIFLAVVSYSQNNPFATLIYDSLVIYDFDWRQPGGGRITSILENEKLATTVKKSVRLPANEALDLSKKIGMKSSYGQITAACFDPHFGMVYYQNGNVKEYITICLVCNYPNSSLPIPARNQGGEDMDNEEIYYELSGFSKSFRKYLNNIKKKYDFSAQTLEGSIFD